MIEQIRIKISVLQGWEKEEESSKDKIERGVIEVLWRQYCVLKVK